MQVTSKTALTAFLKTQAFRAVLDAPAGDGWLLQALGPGVSVDGIDLFADPVPGYRHFWKFDLDAGLPAECRDYDLICCCEGLEHLGNPLQCLRAFRQALRPEGLLIIATPNVWYPQARLQYWFRGFFPSFPPVPGRIVLGSHIHVMPWSWPQLSVFLKLAGFTDARLLPEPLSAAKHLHEHLFAIPARCYCRLKRARAVDAESRVFWQTAMSDAALLGRHLIVVARNGGSL